MTTWQRFRIWWGDRTIKIHDWLVDRLAGKPLWAPVEKVYHMHEGQARMQAKEWWGDRGDVLYKADAARPYQGGLRALPLSTEPPLMLVEVYGSSGVDWESMFAVAILNNHGPRPEGP